MEMKNLQRLRQRASAIRSSLSVIDRSGLISRSITPDYCVDDRNMEYYKNLKAVAEEAKAKIAEILAAQLAQDEEKMAALDLLAKTED